MEFVAKATGTTTSLSTSTNFSSLFVPGGNSGTLSDAQLSYALNMMNATLQDINAQVEESILLSAHIWRIAAAIFVFLMQLGFSLLEAGTVRFKNTRNIMIKNVLDTCVSAIAFWLFGYAIGFGEGSRLMGWEYLNGSVAFAGSQNPIDWFFQFTFCATSATIIAGAVAERTQLWAYLTFNFFMSALIYPVVAHLIWSDNGLLSAGRGATILHTIGVLDNAGSMVVHVSGGVTSLIGAWMVGPRIGRFDIDGKVVPFRGHSMVFIASGTIILWVGFYGFNGGSVSLVGQDPIEWVYEVARVCVNTTLCASFSGVTVWVWTHRKKDPNPEDTFNAVIGGLVAACATSSIVEPYAAAVIGIVSGWAYLWGVSCMHWMKIDDPCQAAPTHLWCGSWGGISAGLFATKQGIEHTYHLDAKSYGLLYGGGGWQTLMQIFGLLIVYVWVGLTTWLLFFILGAMGLVRVRRQEEEVGLDVAFHGLQDDEEAFDEAHQGRRLFNFDRANKNLTLASVLSNLLNVGAWRKFVKEGATGEGFRVKRDVWHRALDNTAFGQFSLAMYEANYVMEDTSELEGSSSGVYIGVHDGHGGTETSEFLKDHLYLNLKSNFVRQGGTVTADAIRTAFLQTDAEFTELVREAFDNSPHLATVGACSVISIITSSAIWVANCGDCRAVLGQVRKVDESSLECRALQLSVDHNLSFSSIREKFVSDHADTPDAVIEKRGTFRVKGKLSVTRSFGDLYLKSKDFNREPLFSRFRVPEPFHPPLVTCEPNIAVRLLSPHDAFVILASDGLFEYVSNQEAVDIVASSPRKDVARVLIRTALHRAAQKHEVKYEELLRLSSGQRREYHDDVSVVVFFFSHQAPGGGGAGAKRGGASAASTSWNRDLSLKGGQDAKLALSAGSVSNDDFSIIQSVHGSSDAKNAMLMMAASNASSSSSSSSSSPRGKESGGHFGKKKSGSGPLRPGSSSHSTASIPEDEALTIQDLLEDEGSDHGVKKRKGGRWGGLF